LYQSNSNFNCQEFVEKYEHEIEKLKLKIDVLESEVLLGKKEKINQKTNDAVCPIPLSKEDTRTNTLDYNPIELPSSIYPIAVLLITYNRPQYLKRSLESIYKYITKDFRMIISQDDNEASVSAEIESWKKAHPDITHIQHKERTKPVWKKKNEKDSYFYIAEHFGWALSYVFERFESVIVLEDDIEISPDFFLYFSSLQRLLQYDPTLYCISAWNDHGHSNRVKSPTSLHRTDFFPGLGWMIIKKFWNEIGPKWPYKTGFWDEWIRMPEQHKGRGCIRPEISRTYTFGEKGSSAGQFYNSFLKGIKLNDQVIDFEKIDVSYLVKNEYDAQFRNVLVNATSLTLKEYSTQSNKDKDIILYYESEIQREDYCRHFKLLHDSKAGIPRASYFGVTTIYDGTNRIFISPKGVLNKI